MTMDSTPGRILGIGGIFFKSPNRDQLSSWYRDKLGIKYTPHGAMFKWQSVEEPPQEHVTVWSIFPSTSNYFAPSEAPFMINYIVDDLGALLAKLREAGVQIDPKQEDHEYGRFGWVYDPDGNKIELWEPPKGS
jgi:catechol 2,3-dioxygenase-like lactoylglutathione lyase family enzyme